MMPKGVEHEDFAYSVASDFGENSDDAERR